MRWSFMGTRSKMRIRPPWRSLSSRLSNSRLLLAEEGDDLLDLPDVIAHASRHRRGTRVRLGEAHVGPREVVVHEVERHGSGEGLDLAGGDRKSVVEGK